MALWKDGQFAADPFVAVVDDDALPDGPILVPVARFLAESKNLLHRNQPLGVVLSPDSKVELVAPYLDRLDLVAVSFPAFSDGRGFSQARLLRERHGFTGELRAVGDILFDRIAYMIRCGFDSLEIVNEPTLAALRAEQLPENHQHYQPAGRALSTVDPLKPWRRAI